MEVSVLSEKVNNTVGRKELSVEVSYSGPTPKRSDLKDAVIAKVGSSPDLTIIKKVEQLAGRTAVRLNVFIYSDDETLKRVEHLYVLKREGLDEESKAKAQEGDGDSQQPSEEN